MTHALLLRQQIGAVLLAVTMLACGVTVSLPTSDGQKGSASVNMQTHVYTVPTIASNLESLFVVTADSLHVRTFPDASAPSTRFLVAGDVVMGICYHMADGSIWLGFERNADGEPTRFSAVLFDGQYLMEGNCQ